MFLKDGTTLRSSATTPFGFHLRARCERGTLDVTNYLFPFLYHAIGVRPDGGRQRFEKAHSAPAGTTTFDLQLAAFAAFLAAVASLMASIERSAAFAASRRSRASGSTIF